MTDWTSLVTWTRIIFLHVIDRQRMYNVLITHNSAIKQGLRQRPRQVSDMKNSESKHLPFPIAILRAI